MNDIIPVENCTGCAACVFICPQEAITMVADAEGFLYPRIDDQKCNACGVCIANCPVKNSFDDRSHIIPVVYAGWTVDRELLRQSTSGGVFSEIARSVLMAGGVVLGAAYDDKMTVRHMSVETWEDLNTLRGSKYVQSDVGDTYRQVERYLKAGRKVLFTGTPCQVAGLYATIGQDHKALLTCDLICHGVPSPKVFSIAIGTIEKRKKSKVIDFKFREKSCGWLYPTVRIVLKKGGCISEAPLDNPFFQGFLKNIYLRPACYQCSIKARGAVSDITLGDFWELSKYQPKLINYAGTSAILANTILGNRTIKQCADRLSLTECPFDYIKNKPNLRNSKKLPAEREAFFYDLERLQFEEITRKYMKPRSVIFRKLVWIRRWYRMWANEWT